MIATYSNPIPKDKLIAHARELGCDDRSETVWAKLMERMGVIDDRRWLRYASAKAELRRLSFNREDYDAAVAVYIEAAGL